MNLRAATCWLLLTLPVASDTFGTGEHEFTIEFLAVGHAGNLPDRNGFGAVDHDYRIAVHEVTRAMIESYNTLSDWQSITMTDMAASGGNGGDRPATGISWEEAVLFVDWLNTSNRRSNPHFDLYTKGPDRIGSSSRPGADDIRNW